MKRPELPRPRASGAARKSRSRGSCHEVDARDLCGLGARDHDGRAYGVHGQGAAHAHRVHESRREMDVDAHEASPADGRGRGYAAHPYRVPRPHARQTRQVQ